MIALRLHVLAGCRDLLRPTPLSGEALAELLGPNLGIATAYWLSPRCGQFYHDFLFDQPEDTRVAVFAAALCDNFGNRAAPLVILPELLAAADGPGVATAEATGPARRGMIEVVSEIWHRIPAEALVLHAVALPEGTGNGDGDWAARLLPGPAGRRLATLRDRLAAAGVRPIEPRLLVADPAGPLFGAFLRNALSWAVAARVRGRLDAEELAVDRGRFAAAAARLLAEWDQLGIAPAGVLGAAGLDRLVGRVLDRLLDHGVPGDA